VRADSSSVGDNSQFKISTIARFAVTIRASERASAMTVGDRLRAIDWAQLTALSMTAMLSFSTDRQ